MKTYTPEIKDKELLDYLRRMAMVAEYREPEALEHQERVRGYSYLLARCLNLTPQDAEIISFACLLHDIGKAGLPEAIVSKTGELTPYEWELMKRHTTIGASMLKGSSSVVLQAGEIVALTHHERWDGSGYPNGLHGEDIPISGRICAIADVFDALTTRRSYKAEIPVDDAFGLIKGASGQLFDPKLVQLFLENRVDVIRIHNLATNRL